MTVNVCVHRAEWNCLFHWKEDECATVFIKYSYQYQKEMVKSSPWRYTAQNRHPEECSRSFCGAASWHGCSEAQQVATPFRSAALLSPSARVSSPGRRWFGCRRLACSLLHSPLQSWWSPPTSRCSYLRTLKGLHYLPGGQRIKTNVSAPEKDGNICLAGWGERHSPVTQSFLFPFCSGS